MRHISTVPSLLLHAAGGWWGWGLVEWFSIAFVCAISEERKNNYTEARTHPRDNFVCRDGAAAGSLFDCAIECKCVLYVFCDVVVDYYYYYYYDDVEVEMLESAKGVS